jgi:hypothetical protein
MSHAEKDPLLVGEAFKLAPIGIGGGAARSRSQDGLVVPVEDTDPGLLGRGGRAA